MITIRRYQSSQKVVLVASNTAEGFRKAESLGSLGECLKETPEPESSHEIKEQVRRNMSAIREDGFAVILSRPTRNENATRRSV